MCAFAFIEVYISRWQACSHLLTFQHSRAAPQLEAVALVVMVFVDDEARMSRQHAAVRPDDVLAVQRLNGQVVVAVSVV